MSFDRLAQSLVASHVANDPAFESFIRGLDRIERDGLIAEIGGRARRSDGGGGRPVFWVLLER